MYEKNVRNHLVPGLGHIALSRLTAQQIQQMYARKLQGGMSVGAVRAVHAVLSAALHDAVRLGLLGRSVAELVKLPAKAPRRARVLTEEQANTPCRLALSDRLGALYMLAMMTSLRAGELLGLRWSDVDLEQGLLLVNVQLERVPRSGDQPGHYELTRPKTEGSRRRIRLSRSACEVLLGHRMRQLEERMAAADVWDGSMDLVFCTELGRPLVGTTVVYHRLQPLLRSAGLPALTMGTFVTRGPHCWWGQSVHQKVVQEVLGHSSFTITMDVYSHVTPDMQEQAAAAVDRIFWRTVSGMSSGLVEEGESGARSGQ